jgi:hypothetical protein
MALSSSNFPIIISQVSRLLFYDEVFVERDVVNQRFDIPVRPSLPTLINSGDKRDFLSSFVYQALNRFRRLVCRQ